MQGIVVGNFFHIANYIRKLKIHLCLALSCGSADEIALGNSANAVVAEKPLWSWPKGFVTPLLIAYSMNSTLLGNTFIACIH